MERIRKFYLGKKVFISMLPVLVLIVLAVSGCLAQAASKPEEKTVDSLSRKKSKFHHFEVEKEEELKKILTVDEGNDTDIRAVQDVYRVYIDKREGTDDRLGFDWVVPVDSFYSQDNERLASYNEVGSYIRKNRRLIELIKKGTSFNVSGMSAFFSKNGKFLGSTYGGSRISAVNGFPQRRSNYGIKVEIIPDGDPNAIVNMTWNFAQGETIGLKMASRKKKKLKNGNVIDVYKAGDAGIYDSSEDVEMSWEIPLELRKKNPNSGSCSVEIMENCILSVKTNKKTYIKYLVTSPPEDANKAYAENIKATGVEENTGNDNEAAPIPKAGTTFTVKEGEYDTCNGWIKFKITKKAPAGKGEGEVELVGISKSLRGKNYMIGYQRDMVLYKGVLYKFTSVGKKAFAGFKGSAVYIGGKYLRKIGSRAFAGCKCKNRWGIQIEGMRSIKFGSKAFYGCKSNLGIKSEKGGISGKPFTGYKGTSIDLELGKMKKLGSKLFAGCVNLDSFTIYAGGLKEIGSKVFANCKKLQYIAFIDIESLKKVNKNAFLGISKNCLIVAGASKAKRKILKNKGQANTVKIGFYEASSEA